MIGSSHPYNEKTAQIASVLNNSIPKINSCLSTNDIEQVKKTIMTLYDSICVINGEFVNGETKEGNTGE